MPKQLKKSNVMNQAKSTSEKGFPINKQARIRLAEAYFNSDDPKIKNMSYEEMEKTILQEYGVGISGNTLKTLFPKDIDPQEPNTYQTLIPEIELRNTAAIYALCRMLNIPMEYLFWEENSPEYQHFKLKKKEEDDGTASTTKTSYYKLLDCKGYLTYNKPYHGYILDAQKGKDCINHFTLDISEEKVVMTLNYFSSTSGQYRSKKLEGIPMVANDHFFYCLLKNIYGTVYFLSFYYRSYTSAKMRFRRAAIIATGDNNEVVRPVMQSCIITDKEIDPKDYDTKLKNLLLLNDDLFYVAAEDLDELGRSNRQVAEWLNKNSKNLEMKPFYEISEKEILESGNDSTVLLNTLKSKAHSPHRIFFTENKEQISYINDIVKTREEENSINNPENCKE